MIKIIAISLAALLFVANLDTAVAFHRDGLDLGVRDSSNLFVVLILAPLPAA